jgi:phage shock protein PspC (stress-responsive transcriptional regulator)
MKKNISINISGIIFHIEEDGYDQLKEYLESINRYFSTFDDSLEIIADIETRIAELFLAKLKEGQQVIGLVDVEELIATMGSIKDFQAAEEENNYSATAEESDEGEFEATEPLFSKKLYRDNNRKLLAGVLAGIAHYLSIDPLWIRLLYALLFLGVSILPSIAGFLLIAYIVLWIAVPPSDDLKEEKKIKKMYRDPDGKVLGGVSSGIAAYFGVDVVIIRLLFIAAIFIGGTGIILYLILWIILPEAKTLTDKMAMQGQPVTLSNIESAIKKSLNVESSEENIIVKILLFPFRLIATLFRFLSNALGPFMTFVVEALRVIAGVILAIIGLSGIVAIIIAAGVVLGLFASGNLNVEYPIPLEAIKSDLSVLSGLAIVMSLIIPFFFLAILGFMVVMKRKVMNASAAWTIAAVWLISIVILSFTIPPYISNFNENGSYTKVDRYSLPGKTAVLSFNDIGEDEFDLIDLRIRSHADTVIKLEQSFSAKGKTRLLAVENAKAIQYGLEVQDSVFRFNSRLNFPSEAGFRNQQLDVTIYMPERQKFIIDEDLTALIGNFIYREGYSNRDLDGNIWMFDTRGLKCTTCPEENTNDAILLEKDWEIRGPRRSYDLADFSSLSFSGDLTVYVTQWDTYEVIVNGDEDSINDLVIDQNGNDLEIDYSNGRSGDSDEELRLYIACPSLSELALTGPTKLYMETLTTDDLKIELSGDALAELDINAKIVEATVDGASVLRLSGTGELLDVKVRGSSKFDGFDFDVLEASIKTYFSSTANVFARDALKIKAHGASTVVYSGNANVDIEKSGASSARRK